MRWTYVLCATFVVGSLIPAATADEASEALCTPVADATAQKVADRYYKQSATGFEIWRETNGIPGLQENSEMACGAPADFEWVNAGASGL